MSSNTKIVVLRSKELVYALVLLVVSILIIMVAVSLFIPSGKNAAAPSVPSEGMPSEGIPSEGTPSDGTQGEGTSGTGSSQSYVPGIYSSTLQLGNSNVELQITVDKNHINSINLANIDESVATLYPLMSPTLDTLAAAILSRQSIDGISYTEESRYTSMLLMKAISDTLDKARIAESAKTEETGVIY